MKHVYHSMVAVAIAAMAFTGCSKDQTEAPADEKRMTVITVNASNEIENAPLTRTHLDETTGKIHWDTEKEELIYVVENAATGLKEAASNPAVINGNKAQFTVAFETRGDNAFTYGAVYPASNFIDKNENLTKIKAALPSLQTPTATSFDAAADLMMTLAVSQTAQPTELNFRFGRIAALAKMTITNLGLASGEKVKTVSFAATGKVLSGRSYLDFTTGKIAEIGYYGASEKVELDMNAIDVDPASFPAWFTCLPCKLDAGDTFTVVVSTDQFKTYTRTVTIPESRNIVFNAGDIAEFTVNMTGITGVESSSDARIATLTYDEVAAKSFSYDTSYNYTNAGGIWDIRAYKNLGFQLNGTKGYIKLPVFDQPIVLIEAVTISTDNTLMLSSSNSTGSAVASQKGDKTTLFTLDLSTNTVTTGYLKSSATLVITSLKIYTGASIIMADITDVTASGIENATATYTTAAFNADDDTVMKSFDGTVVTAASVNPDTKTVTYTVSPNVTGSAREGSVTLFSANNDAETTFKIFQVADKFVVAPETLTLGGDAGATSKLTLTSDFAVGTPVVSDATKFSVSEPVDNVYTVTALTDGGSEETQIGTITFIRTTDSKQLTVTVNQAAKGSSGYKEFWKDDFSNATGNTNLTKLSGSVAGFTGNYSGFKNASACQGAIKIGTSKAGGTFITPALSAIPAGETVDLKITLKAEGWNKKSATLTLTANNAGTVQEKATAITSSESMSGTTPSMSPDAATYTFTVTGATNATTITLTSAVAAVGIDDLLIATN